LGFGFSLLIFSHLSAQSKLYWSDWGNNKIQSANLDGSGVVDIASGLSNAKGDVALDLVNKKVFWIDNTAGILQKSNLVGLLFFHYRDERWLQMNKGGNNPNDKN
jgi:hypothetical protein